MMKINNRIMIVMIITFLLIIIPIVVLGYKTLIKYDNNGRAIVDAKDGIPEELPEGAQISLAVPIENNKTTEEEQQEEKWRIAKEIQNEVPVNTKPNSDGSELFKDENAKEEQFKEILEKYYGKERIESIIKEIENETNLLNSNPKQIEYVFPSSGEELLKISLDLIELNKVNNEEKNILIDGIKMIDISSLKNQDIIERINNL